MKITWLLILFFVIPLSANPQEKSSELCSCLKKAKDSGTSEDKGACLNMREKHVKQLKKGSKNYTVYIESLQKCERSLEGSESIDPTLSADQKAAKVCECFQKSAKSDRMLCFRLQSEYGKTISDDEARQNFNQSSNSCDK
ncbi:MAG: hypothetical protein O9264_11685 [Leptospira sp.]|nr:hypothetical protein [Leptospira sp.]